MNAALVELVRSRADGRCEYCRLPQSAVLARHVIDHVIAQQHDGPTVPGNLALCCQRCNLHKGPNLAGIDPATGLLTRLFHPRSDMWADHFAAADERIEPLTDVGRATERVLQLNADYRLDVRRELSREGLWP